MNETTSHDAEIEVDCPGCGLAVVGSDPRASAEWFCPRCDYPLFWVAEPEAEARTEDPNRGSRRRLPGTGGRVGVGASACWHCGEQNEAGVAECLRCAARLPKPLAPTVTVIEEIHVPVPVPVRAVMWPFVAAAACGGAAIASAVAVWLGGGP